MIRPLSLALHTLYADLLEQGVDDLFDPDLPENGSILVRGNRASASADHVYYQGYRPAVGQAARGQRFTRYLGRADNPTVSERIAQFHRIKAARAERATTVRALSGAGMPRPDRLTGRAIEALARAGLFPDQAVLNGEAAAQTYSGVLGVRLPKPRKAARGAEPTLEIVIRNRHWLPRILLALDAVDPRLTVALDVVGARPLDGLGFLIHQPVQSVILRGPGIAVSVPAPERYAVHKLIVQGRRPASTDGQSRASGDVAQAAELIEAIAIADRERTLKYALTEAWEREPQWRSVLLSGIQKLPEPARATLDAEAKALNARMPAPVAPW